MIALAQTLVQKERHRPLSDVVTNSSCTDAVEAQAVLGSGLVLIRLPRGVLALRRKSVFTCVSS